MDCFYIFITSPFHIVFKLWWVQVDTPCHMIMKGSIPCKVLSKILGNQIIEASKP